MRVFHVRAESVTDAGATGALRRLGEALQALLQRALAAEDFEPFEQEGHALFAAAARGGLGEGLTGLERDRPCGVIDGQRHPRVRRSTET